MRSILFLFFSLIITAPVVAQSKTDIKLSKEINNSKVTDISICYSDSIKTNQPIDITINVKTKKGKLLISKGIINILCFDIESPDVFFNFKGQLVVKQNKESLLTHNIRYRITCKKDKTIKCDTSINLNYQGTLILNYSGKNGENGKKGGKIIATNNIYGDKGENGSVGQKGENGHIIDVFAEMVNDLKLNKKLIYIKVFDKTDSTTRYYITDPEKSEIAIKVNGGNGGNGGTGGDGGKGTSKNTKIDSHGNPISAGGSGGHGGNGGHGGKGGDCGNVVLILSEDMAKYKSLFSLEFYYGNGGKGGLPGQNGPDGNTVYNGKNVDNFQKEVKVKKSANDGINGSDGDSGECNNTPKIKVENIEFKLPE